MEKRRNTIIIITRKERNVKGSVKLVAKKITEKQPKSTEERNIYILFIVYCIDLCLYVCLTVCMSLFANYMPQFSPARLGTN